MDIKIEIDNTKKALADTQTEIGVLVEKWKNTSATMHEDVGSEGLAFNGKLANNAIGKWDENNEKAFETFNKNFDKFEGDIDAFIRQNASFQSEVSAQQSTLGGAGTGTDQIYG